MNRLLQSTNQRIVIGILAAAISFLCLLRGGFLLLFASLLFILLGVREYEQILEKKGIYPSAYIIVFVSFLISSAAVFKFSNFILLILFFGILLTFFSAILFKKKPYIINISTTILGFLLSWLACFIIFLSQMNTKTISNSYYNITDGIGYIIFLVCIVIITDSSACYFGKKYGKKKLLEEISPNKTVFGAVIGYIIAIIVSLIIGKYLLNITLLNSFILGSLISVSSQFGDLSISLLKRDAGIKHSGTLFLENGGLLDRIDSFIFSAPLTFYYAQFLNISNQQPINYIFNLLF